MQCFFVDSVRKTIAKKDKKMSQKTIIVCMKMALVAVAVSGCSTLTGEGTAQSVTVETYEGQYDNRVYDASCKLTNDEGSWTVVAPGAVMIHRSNKLLNVECKKDGYIQDAVAVDSTTKANMFGNIIFGGGIGAIIDHNNGSAYDYPDVIQVPMRKMPAEESRPISDEQDQVSTSNF